MDINIHTNSHKCVPKKGKATRKETFAANFTTNPQQLLLPLINVRYAFVFRVVLKVLHLQNFTFPC